MAYINTIELSGGETAAEIVSCRYVCIKNRGTETVYASRYPGVTADGEGVMPIEPGESAVYPDCGNTLYLLGSGKVTIVCSDSGENYFSALEGNDDPIISCKAYGPPPDYSDTEVEIDVSGAKYYGVWKCGGATGAFVSEIPGKTSDFRNSVYVSFAKKMSYIAAVPAAGKIYANIADGFVVVMTSNSYKALTDALGIGRLAMGFANEDT